MPTLLAGKVSRLDRPVVDRHGFTLLELLVVLTLMALMAGMVAPRLVGTLDRMNVRSAAGRIVATLRYARSQAASEQRFFRVDIDLSGRTLTVAPASPLPEALASRGTLSLPEGVRFLEAQSVSGASSSDTFTIRFSPLGRTTGGQLLIGDEAGRRLRVVLDPLTGLPEIHES